MIGAPIEPQTKKPEDAAAKDKDRSLSIARWPVTHQLFRQGREEGRRPAGRADPDLRDPFEMYENGISRALPLDYGDFVIAGEMTQLEIRPAKPCK